MNLELALSSFLKLCGVLGIIAGTVRAIVYFATPYKNITKKLERHDELFANDKRALDELKNQVHYEKECINAIGLAIAELINHEVSGNDINELKERQRELNKVLLQYQQSYQGETHKWI